MRANALLSVMDLSQNTSSIDTQHAKQVRLLLQVICLQFELLGRPYGEIVPWRLLHLLWEREYQEFLSDSCQALCQQALKRP